MVKLLAKDLQKIYFLRQAKGLGLLNCMCCLMLLGIAMLLDLLQPLLERLPKDEKEAAIELLPDLIDAIPQKTSVPGIVIVHRQRYAANGLLDNLVIKTNKYIARALGLWAIMTAMQNKTETYYLELKNNDSDIKVNRNNLNSSQIRYGLIVSPTSFSWKPGKLESKLEQWQKGYLGQRCQLKITNQNEEYFTKDEYINNRTILSGFGGIGGGCVFGEFLLDLALDSCGLNYEYLKDQHGNSILDEFSCEARVELHNSDR